MQTTNKTNKTMIRVLAALLILVIISSCMVSGIFAKYVVQSSSEVGILFKQWGITVAPVEDDLNYYYVKDDKVVVKLGGSNIPAGEGVTYGNIIAPGTKGALMSLRVSGTKPEVPYAINFSGNISIGQGFGKIADIDSVFILEYVLAEKMTAAIEKYLEDYEKEHGEFPGGWPNPYTDIPQSAFAEMAECAVAGEAKDVTALANMIMNHRGINASYGAEAKQIIGIYQDAIDGKFDRDIENKRRELRILDEKYREIEYFPIVISIYQHTLDNSGKVESSVLASKHCVNRASATNANGVYFFTEQGDNRCYTHNSIEDMVNALNSTYFAMNNTNAITKSNNANVGINNVYSVEWEWLYHYDTVAENKSNSNRDTTAAGDYQTAMLDTKLGELIAKYPSLFYIEMEMTATVFQTASTATSN